VRTGGEKMSHKLVCPYCKEIIISGKNIIKGDVEYFEHLKKKHEKEYKDIMNSPAIFIPFK